MLELAPNKRVSFTISVLNQKGNPARFDGAPVFANSNPGAVDLIINPDGVSGYVNYLDGGLDGLDAQISCTVDADLGPGVQEIKGLGDIHALPLTATVVQLNFGAPEDIPPAQ